MERLETPADFEWAAALMARRREVYATYSPVFWRPATNARAIHGRFLAKRATASDSVALRTDAGFLIAEPRVTEGFIDDFAVEPDAAWATDGAALLTEAWNLLDHESLSGLRVVTAEADGPKVAMLRACSLEVRERWWVRPLQPTGPAGPTGRVAGPGFTGVLSPAPPVYDPGGPVLLVQNWPADVGAAAIAEEAARMGAVLAILAVSDGDPRQEDLPGAGWTVASGWYVGVPTPA